MVKTRSSMIEKENQASSTAGQITNLAPIVKNPQIRDLAQSVKKTPSAPSIQICLKPQNASTTQPILLVKVYQEAVQSIVQLKSDVAGLQALETHQRQAYKSELAIGCLLRMKQSLTG